MIIMFLPGMDLLTWDEYAREVPWDLVIMLGCLMALATALLSTGAIDWVATVSYTHLDVYKRQNEYSVEWAAKVTEVPEQMIRDVAHCLAEKP